MKECITHHHACDCRERMLARAVEIADKAMVFQLEGTAVPGEDGDLVSWPLETIDARFHPLRFWLCDETQADVSHLADANPYLREAFEWLSQRGLATLREGDKGQFIELTLNKALRTA